MASVTKIFFAPLTRCCRFNKMSRCKCRGSLRKLPVKSAHLAALRWKCSQSELWNIIASFSNLNTLCASCQCCTWQIYLLKLWREDFAETFSILCWHWNKRREKGGHDLILLMPAQVRIYHCSCGADNQISCVEIFQVILCKLKSTEFQYISSPLDLTVLLNLLITQLLCCHLTYPV